MKMATIKIPLKMINSQNLKRLYEEIDQLVRMPQPRLEHFDPEIDERTKSSNQQQQRNLRNRTKKSDQLGLEKSQSNCPKNSEELRKFFDEIDNFLAPSALPFKNGSRIKKFDRISPLPERKITSDVENIPKNSKDLEQLFSKIDSFIVHSYLPFKLGGLDEEERILAKEISNHQTLREEKKKVTSYSSRSLERQKQLFQKKCISDDRIQFFTNLENNDQPNDDDSIKLIKVEQKFGPKPNLKKARSARIPKPRNPKEKQASADIKKQSSESLDPNPISTITESKFDRNYSIKKMIKSYQTYLLANELTKCFEQNPTRRKRRKCSSKSLSSLETSIDSDFFSHSSDSSSIISSIPSPASSIISSESYDSIKSSSNHSSTSSSSVSNRSIVSVRNRIFLCDQFEKFAEKKFSNRNRRNVRTRSRTMNAIKERDSLDSHQKIIEWSSKTLNSSCPMTPQHQFSENVLSPVCTPACASIFDNNNKNNKSNNNENTSYSLELEDIIFEDFSENNFSAEEQSLTKQMDQEFNNWLLETF